MNLLRNSFRFEKFADIYFPSDFNEFFIVSALFEYLNRLSRTHLRILGRPRNFNKIFVTHSRPPLVAHLKAMIILNTFDKSRPPRGEALDMYNSLGFRPSHEIVPV